MNSYDNARPRSDKDEDKVDYQALNARNILNRNKEAFKRFVIRCQLLCEEYELHDYYLHPHKHMKLRSSSLRVIAKNLDLGEEMLRKRISLTKGAQERDFAIALLYVLNCDVEEINFALPLYGQPALDEKCTRDYLIMEKVTADHGKSIYEVEDRFDSSYPNIHIYSAEETNRSIRKIDPLNKYLLENGQPSLIYKNTKKKKTIVLPNENSNFSPFPSGVSPRIVTSLDEGDLYCSLETEHALRNICRAGVKLENGTFLEVTSDRVFIIRTPWPSEDSKEEIIDIPNDSPEHFFYKRVNSLEQTGDYRKYFEYMLTEVLKEKQRIDRVLCDSKNHKNGRFGAKMIDDALLLFYEEFNYIYPELNEYFYVEYYKGKYHFEVTHQSKFMLTYLGEEKFSEIFGNLSRKPFIKFDSLESIQKRQESFRLNTNSYIILRGYQSAFRRLQSFIDAKIEEIKTRKIFVRNREMIFDEFDGLDSILKWYGAYEQYKCKYIETSECITFDCAPSYMYQFDDSTEIEITQDDVLRAFELGYDDFDQIAYVKKTKGDVSSVF